MGRVINPDGVGKQRQNLTRSVVLSLRELSAQSKPDEHTRDLAAYIALALQAIMETVDQSVLAWEKRGYWIKADRFRMDWYWAERGSNQMRDAVMREDWSQVALTAAMVAEKLQHVKLPKRHKLGTPWVGAWKRLQELETN